MRLHPVRRGICYMAPLCKSRFTWHWHCRHACVVIWHSEIHSLKWHVPRLFLHIPAYLGPKSFAAYKPKLLVVNKRKPAPSKCNVVAVPKRWCEMLDNHISSLGLGALPWKPLPRWASTVCGTTFSHLLTHSASDIKKMLLHYITPFPTHADIRNSGSALQDISTFLAWAAEPEHDERKLSGVKWLFILSLVWATAIYYKRWKWSPIKSRRIIVDAVN